MTAAEWLGYKFRAARTLSRMMRWLSNWREVWASYRADLSPPPLRFRSGLTLYHGPQDSPIALLHEVFGERQYRRHLNGAVEGVMIDLGANIGAVTLDWALNSRRPLRVHAYEPNPQTNKTLRRNIEANGLTDRVTVYDEAVGGDSGELRLWTNVNSMTSTAYADGPPAPSAIATRVAVVDLDEVVRRAGGGPVALLKMDTEGAEVDTLEGASPATLGVIRRVILEYHLRACPDAHERCRKVLEEAGFRCRLHPIHAYHGLLYAWRPRVSLDHASTANVSRDEA